MLAWKAALKRSVKKVLPGPVFRAFRILKYPERSLIDTEIYQSFVEGKKGLEIGGPSDLFRIRLPLYRKAGSVDGVNFSGSTVWEGAIVSGHTFAYLPECRGLQFIADATDLSQIESASYDFVLSSNCLEHVANPIKALLEWRRVIRPGGALILVVPNKASNFDHNRPFTTFEHILDDYERATAEQDLTHLDEILALHDLSMDPPAGSFDEFKARSLANFENRTLHHHVFEPATIGKMLHYVGLTILATTETGTDFFSLATRG